MDGLSSTYSGLSPAYATVGDQSLRYRKSEDLLSTSFYARTIRDLEKMIKKSGGSLARSSSHKIFKIGNRTASVPHGSGSKELGKGLFNAILKQLGLK